MIQFPIRYFAVILCIASGVQNAGAAPPTLSIDTGVELSWETVSGRNYQVQWTSNPESEGDWKDLGRSMAGDGKAHSLIDPSPGVRTYRVLTHDLGPSEGSNIVMNSGFETGNASAADRWIATGGIFLRSDEHQNEGAFSMHSSITNGGDTPRSGLLVQQLVPAGGLITTGATYTFSFWVKQVRFGPSYVQNYRVDWLGAGGDTIASTDYQSFRGEDGVWQKVSTSELTTPENAVDARITFYLATGSVVGGHGEVFLDDVALESAAENAEATHAQDISVRKIAIVRWPTMDGVTYQPQTTSDLSSGQWNDLAPVMGDGSIRSANAPLTGNATFFRLRYHSPVPPDPGAPSELEPAAGVRAIPTGLPGTLMLAWDASPGPNVSRYRILYGTAEDQLTESSEVGNITSATLLGLIPGQTYYISVVALNDAGSSSLPTAAVPVEAELLHVIAPLFNISTQLEPDVLVDTPTALVTYLADRARDRHAREDIVGGVIFRAYDHYLPWYWEQRVANIEIIDRIAKGGTTITFNYTTQARLNPAEFRAFFNVASPLSGYHHNAQASLVSIHPSTRYPGETDYNYTSTLSILQPDNRPLQLGDKIEIEISQFLLGSTLRNGRENYYGTTFLYVVGEGVVPWYAKIREETTDPAEKASSSFDSYPLPESAWLGGLTTLPYQYSNEPEDRFKQTAGNISPESGHPFMLGRRLHHTNFHTGAHSEPGNPGLASHAGKVGDKFVAHSCVSCHANNGRALPPDVGAMLVRSGVKVGNDASGTPHPVLGEQLQPFSTSSSSEGAAFLSGYTEIPGAYGDGTLYTLRKPIYTFEGIQPSHFSVRSAPPLVGLGLLEAVDESRVLALADPDDVDGDGISGRPALIDDPEQTGVKRLGRFGHKGTQSRVKHQIAHALNRDMGVTTELFPILDGESAPRPPELTTEELEQLTRYVSVLGVAAQRDLIEPEVVRGKALFQSASCVSCHTPALQTSAYHPLAELRNQTIRPHTDLLLHDMGPGLADNMGEGAVSGAEWRTAPLWNIGLTAGVSGGEAYLHDGRARTLEEAILWHGGEAEQAKENFRTMPAADREALIQFLKSL